MRASSSRSCWWIFSWLRRIHMHVPKTCITPPLRSPCFAGCCAPRSRPRSHPRPPAIHTLTVQHRILSRKARHPTAPRGFRASLGTRASEQAAAPDQALQFHSSSAASSLPPFQRKLLGKSSKNHQRIRTSPEVAAACYSTASACQAASTPAANCLCTLRLCQRNSSRES